MSVCSGAWNYVSYSHLFRGFCRTHLDWYAPGSRPVGASKTKIARRNCRGEQAPCGDERELPVASQATRIEISEAPSLYARLQIRAIAAVEAVLDSVGISACRLAPRGHDLTTAA